jgi:hypothetical protein
MVKHTAVYLEWRRMEEITVDAKDEMEALEKLAEELRKRIRKLESEGWRCEQEEPTTYLCTIERGGLKHELTVSIELVE